MQETTRQRLKERQDTPLVLPSSEESFNSTSLQTNSKVSSPVDDSKQLFHSRSGYNLRKQSRLSAHPIFVLDVEGNPLTPTTCARVKKLIKSKQAKPVWNKFSQFGIQMLVETRREIPSTVLGVDFGTKFEGYSVVTGKENNLAVMWRLPDKKKIVRKLEERRNLRRTRRQRNCRRREARFDNREKEGFIAPAQKVMILSRLKAIQEFFKCYPIDTVAIEDVCFNHKKNRWGKNFSTVEIGKQYLYNWIQERARLRKFTGYDTHECRDKYGYKKSGDKSAEVFNAHCSDALAIATDIYTYKHIEQGKFIVVDDTYRAVRRRLHDIRFSKGHIRYPYSTGNFKGVRKGTICNFGQICGGTKKYSWIRNWENKRIGRANMCWLSKRFKTKEVTAIYPQPNCDSDCGFLAER